MTTIAGPRLPGIGSHHAANPQTDEWLTPPHITDALGPFDLDPCAPHQRPDWTKARRWYTATDDGLTARWQQDELVWCNPPYSNAQAWMAKLADHGAGIALVFARVETRWWFDHVWPAASGLLFLRGRLTFHRPSGEPAKAGRNSGGPSVLIAYGSTSLSRLERSGLSGSLVTAPWRVTP